eukprot:TRINITY_DN6417_c0_g1_i2.p1 TRINITY_DN6417_c0_g1~~TRINITY_DN6417_c0_g1_i2.p1  ORF type:complete len:265 (-),score=29.82 TRINITY_DN6417_c0_g1_i2:128-922(-)
MSSIPMDAATNIVIPPSNAPVYVTSQETSTTVTNSQGQSLNAIHTTVYVTPIAAPSILGLFAFAFSTVIVGTRYAHWWGISQSPLVFWPIIMMLGIAQGLTALWAFKARDNLATVFHGAWGAFWIAYAILAIYFTRGILSFVAFDGNEFDSFGMYWITLCAVSCVMIAASFAESLIWVLMNIAMAAGSLLIAIAYFGGHYRVLKAGGWLIFFGACFAFYQATAWLLEYQYGRPILPSFRLGRRRLAETGLINRGFGEPGVKKGQ